MFSNGGGDGSGANSGLHTADGETYEIRYVDAAEAASWACDRGFLLNPEDIPPTVLAYFE
ncbi:MAG TPA: hypothetical protein VHZ96_12345 [Frankiaceae bacterium]|jgi:hypothetical protein|nr:hypothetical protein [Frankiaceae bacterium]